MPRVTKDLEYYDDILFFCSELTMGQGGTEKEIYEGARNFGRFLLSEIERHYEVVNNDNPHAVANGEVMPNSLINTWLYEALNDCNENRIVPPPELLEAVYLQLGCTHRNEENQYSRETRSEFYELIAKEPNIGLREAARRLGVSTTAIKKWKDNPYQGDWDPDRYQELKIITRVEEFCYPR
jgi:hypothetical protein